MVVQANTTPNNTAGPPHSSHASGNGGAPNATNSGRSHNAKSHAPIIPCSASNPVVSRNRSAKQPHRQQTTQRSKRQQSKFMGAGQARWSRPRRGAMVGPWRFISAGVVLPTEGGGGAGVDFGPRGKTRVAGAMISGRVKDGHLGKAKNKIVGDDGQQN